jgi:crotonobetainyl-CoA:carnitine CoA-transferase CaiB-like acyl-CoA transferase
LKLCDALDLPGLRARSDLANSPGRLAAVDEIERAIAERTAGREVWELSEALQAAGVPASAVEDVGDLVGVDPMRHGFLQQIEHPAGISMLLQHEPITWDGERLPVSRAPFMGEHTAEVLCGLLGLTDEELADLAAAGVLS